MWKLLESALLTSDPCLLIYTSGPAGLTLCTSRWQVPRAYGGFGRINPSTDRADADDALIKYSEPVCSKRNNSRYHVRWYDVEETCSTSSFLMIPVIPRWRCGMLGASRGRAVAWT